MRGDVRGTRSGGKACCAYRAQRWRDRRHGGPESSPRAESDEKILSFESEKELDFFEPHAWHAQVPSDFLISNKGERESASMAASSPPLRAVRSACRAFCSRAPRTLHPQP